MPADPDCVFCKIASGELPARIVAQDERTVAFMDLAPATRGHLLVIPREHSTNIHEISKNALIAVHESAKRLADRQLERLGADGVTILQSNGRAAWQTVFHFHVHVIPRYEGDPLRLPWDPREGDDAEIESAFHQLR